MHLPLLFRTRTSIADAQDALQSLLQHGFSKNGQCRLLTRTRSGEYHARTARLFGWSPGASATLWFMVPRHSQLTWGVRGGAQVMVEIADSKLARVLHVAGRSTLIEGRHESVYLHPSVDSAVLRIDSDPLDFVFVRVELERAGEEHAPVQAASLAAA
jgi:hypothetical protein